MSSPDFASEVSTVSPSFPGLALPMDHSNLIRRSSRARSSEPDSPNSAKRQRQISNSSLRLPRGVQRQSRNGAAYSGWVTVEGYRLLGPARPTAELASLDRERLAEAKVIGGLPEARKVIQQLHSEVASTRRIKSQYLPVLGSSSMLHSTSPIQLRSSSTTHLSPLTRNLPGGVAVITSSGSNHTWFLRSDKLFASFSPRAEMDLEKGVYMLEFGALRHTVEEARRDAHPGSGIDEPIVKEDMTELGATTHKQPQSQDSVWGFCGVAELVLENRTAYVGVCVFCDVILTAGPSRGSRSSAESDAFLMVSEVLASGISYASSHHKMPQPNPAEDLFLPRTTTDPEITTDDNMISDPETEPLTPQQMDEEFETKSESGEEDSIEDDRETNVPITPSGPLPVITGETSSEYDEAAVGGVATSSSWSATASEEDKVDEHTPHIVSADN